MKKRLLSILLAALMIVSLLPTAAFAGDDEQTEIVEETVEKITETPDKESVEEEPKEEHVEEQENEEIQLAAVEQIVEQVSEVLENGQETTVVAKIGDTEYATLNEALGAANEGDTVEIIKAATYSSLPSGLSGFTILGGVQDVILDGSTNPSQWSNMTVKNVTVSFGQDSYKGFQHNSNLRFEECVFTGLHFSYGNETYYKCTFNQTNGEYNMWMYGTTVTYDECTFNCQGKCINVYNEGSVNPLEAIFKKCHFNSTAKNKSAVNVKETCGSTILKCDVSFEDCVIDTPEFFPTDKNGGSMLWMVDDLAPDGKGETVVTVNGVKVWENGEKVEVEAPSVVIGEGEDAKDTEVTIEQNSDVMTEGEGVAKEIKDLDNETKTAIATNTKVTDVNLTTTVEEGKTSGLQAVVDKAIKENTELADAIKNAEIVNVEVKVSVVPTEFKAPVEATQETPEQVGTVTFELKPTAIVTVGTGGDAKSQKVDIDNNMIDQSKPITVSFYTGFEPAKIVHTGDNGFEEVFRPTGNKTFSYNNGVCTLQIRHFSKLTALSEDYAAEITRDSVTTKYATLAEAVATAKTGDTIELLAGTIEEGEITLPATLTNVTIKGAADNASVLKNTQLVRRTGSANYDGLIVDGVVFDNSRIMIVSWDQDSSYKNFVFKNNTFRNLDDTTNEAAIHINVNTPGRIQNLTLANNTFDGITGGQKSGVYGTVTGNISITGNTINNVAFRPLLLQIIDTDGTSDDVTVTENTFSGSSVGRLQIYGSEDETTYAPIGTDNGTFLINNNIFKGITDAQQICCWGINTEKVTADITHNYYDQDNPKMFWNDFNGANSFFVNDNPEIAAKLPHANNDNFGYYTELGEDGKIDTESYVNVVSLVPEGAVKVADGFYQNGATYTASTEFYITGKEGLIFFGRLVNGEVATLYPAGLGGPANYSSQIFANKTVKLVCDIDLAGVDWEPIGNPKNVDGTARPDKACFYGSFDGGNHVISNLKCERTGITDTKAYYVGLFGYYVGSGTIKNVEMKNVTLLGYNNVGAIVGNTKSGNLTIENCKLTGTNSIKATYGWAACVGGIAGISNGTIKNCTVSDSTTITSESGSDAGGVVGQKNGGTVSGCNVAETVTVSAVKTPSAMIAGNVSGTGVKVVENTCTGKQVGASQTDTLIGRDVAYDATGKVVGGTFEKIPEDQIGTGFTAYLNEDGTYGVEKTHVAKIGDNEYTSVKAALEAANKLTGDAVIKIIVPEVVETEKYEINLQNNTTITTDLENAVIDFAFPEDTCVEAFSPAVNFTVAEKITIKNLAQTISGAGKNFNIYGDVSMYQFWAFNGGTVNIYPSASVKMGYGDGMIKLRYNGTLNVNGNGINSENQQLSGGYVSGDYDGNKILNLNNTYMSTAWVTNAGNGSFTINLNNAVLKAESKVDLGAASTNTINMNVGSQIITGQISNVAAINVDLTDATEASYKIIDYTGSGTMTLESFGNVVISGNDDFKLVVTENDLVAVAKDYVAQIGEKKYESLEDALDAAVSGDIVKVLRNIETTDNLTIGNLVFLDLNHKTVITTGTITNNGSITLYNENVDIIDYLLYNVPGDYAAGEELKLLTAHNQDYIVPEGTFVTAKVGDTPAYQQLDIAVFDNVLVWNKDVPAGMQLDVTYSLTLGGDILGAKSEGIKPATVTANHITLSDNITIGGNNGEGEASLVIESIHYGEDDPYTEEDNVLGTFNANGKKIILNRTGKLVISSDVTGFDENVLVSGVAGLVICKSEDEENGTIIYTIGSKGNQTAPADGEGYTVDRENGKIIPNEGYEIRAEIGKFDTKELPLRFDVPYFVRKAGTDKLNPSPETEFTVAKGDQTAPAEGEGYTVDRENGKIIPNEGYEIRAEIGKFAAKELPLRFDVPYYVRKIETDKLNPSPETEFTISEIVCEYTKTVKLAEGTYSLKLNGINKGEFTFTKKGSGWNIKNAENKYLAMKDGKLKLSTEPFAWTYKNDAFSASVKTTQKSSGYWFGFIYIPGRGSKTVTTTYYLSTVADGAKLSTCSVCAELYTTVSGNHDFGCWIDCKDGANHKHVCKNCGEVETEAHKYDNETHKCVCGAYDPSCATMDVTATYATKTQMQFSGFLFWGTWKNVTTYTATVKVNAEGLKVTKVEVAASENGCWTKSNTFTSNSEIEQFFVRVTTNDGAKYLFRVVDGIGYPAN